MKTIKLGQRLFIEFSLSVNTNSRKSILQVPDTGTSQFWFIYMVQYKLVSFLCSRQWTPWTPPLKDRQRFDAVLTSNLEVYKFRDWWILTYFIFGHGESSLIFEAWWILNERAFYCFIIFFIWKRILTYKKQISLVNLHPTLFLRWWILTQLFWKRGELMVNPDLMILSKRWIEVKTWGGWVQDALWRMH